MIIISTHRLITVQRKKNPNTHINKTFEWYMNKINTKHKGFFLLVFFCTMWKKLLHWLKIRLQIKWIRNIILLSISAFDFGFFFLDGKVNFKTKNKKYHVVSYVFIYIQLIDIVSLSYQIPIKGWFFFDFNWKRSRLYKEKFKIKWK